MTLLNSHGKVTLRDRTVTQLNWVRCVTIPTKAAKGYGNHPNIMWEILLTTCQQKRCKPDQNRCQYVHHKWPGITVFVWRPKELCLEADWYGPRKERQEHHFGLVPLAWQFVSNRTRACKLCYQNLLPLHKLIVTNLSDRIQPGVKGVTGDSQIWFAELVTLGPSKRNITQTFLNDGMEPR